MLKANDDHFRMEVPKINNSRSFNLKSLRQFVLASFGWVITLLFVLSHIIGGISDMNFMTNFTPSYQGQSTLKVSTTTTSRPRSEFVTANRSSASSSDPLVIHILSSNPRSGSSYLAEILSPVNHKLNLNSSYFFEPLMWLYFPVPEDKNITDFAGSKGGIKINSSDIDEEVEEAVSVPTPEKLRMISDFQSCQFSNQYEILSSYEARQFTFRKPKRGLGVKKRALTEQNLRDLKMLDNLTESCKKSRIRLTKHVRLRLSEILQAPNITDTKVILLTRDPRAIINSVLLAPQPWRKKFKTPSIVCSNALQDLNTFSEQSREGVIHVRYEDLVNPSMNELGRILEFLRIPQNLRPEFFKARLKQRTLPSKTPGLELNSSKTNRTNSTRSASARQQYYSTKREEGFQSDGWRSQIPKDVLKSIESNPICAKLFDKLGLVKK